MESSLVSFEGMESSLVQSRIKTSIFVFLEKWDH